jgi:endogenous inhibitor of DNA gyrase (YacG/DUF329 family)
MSQNVVNHPKRGRAGARRCPICGRPSVAELAPFCSKHCADEDLARWLTGAYRIPTAETAETAADDGNAAEPAEEKD